MTDWINYDWTARRRRIRAERIRACGEFAVMLAFIVLFTLVLK